MIVLLSEECTIFNSRHEAHLQSLLYVAAKKNWHLIARPSLSKLRALLPSHLWRLYGDYLTQSIKSIPNSPQRMVSFTNCNACDPARIASYCNLQCLLLVENRHTDGRWIIQVAERLRPRLSKAFHGNYPAVSVRQAGGIGEIPKELRALAVDHQRVHPGGRAPFRLVVMSDSDAKHPGDISAQALDVKRTSRELGVTAHVLQKRSIENYIPDDALIDFASTRVDRQWAVQKITSLPPPARDHYPMKDGLTDSDIEHSKGLYPEGFPRNLKLGDFMHDFLDNFSYTLENFSLRQRDGVGELDLLLDALEQNL